MKAFLNSRYFILFGGLLIVLQFLIVFSVVNYFCLFNSDTFYLPSVYQDVFHGYGWEGWQLNPAPNFFPDMIAYFFIYFFSGENLSIATFVFAVIQYFFILVLLYKLFKKLFISDNFNRNFVVGSLLVSLFLLVCVVNDNFYSAFHLTSNSYHLGAFINVLLAFILTINYIQKKKLLTIFLLVLLVLISSFSDKLFVVQYVAVVIFLLLFRISKDRIKSLMRIGIVFFMGLIPIVVFTLIRESDYIGFNSAPSRLTPEFIQNSIYKFVSHMQIMLSSSIIEFFIIIISFASYVLLLVKVIQNRKEVNFSVLGLFFFLSFTLFAPVFSGLYQDVDSIRYNITFYLLALFVFPYVLDLFKVKQYFNNSLAIIIPISFTVVILFNINKMNDLDGYFQHKDSYTETLDELKTTYSLKNGIATYWLAKKNMILSKNELRIYSVFEDLTEYTHVTNRRWFRENKDGTQAVFNFVIIENDETLKLVGDIFEKYELIESGEVKLCITPDFYFPKGQRTLRLLSDYKSN